MPYNPSSDFVGLWSAVSGGVQKAQMPGLDFVVQALGRAGLLRISTSATAPITNQLTTAWFRPTSPSFSGEGTLFLWDASLNMYVPATPELFLAMLGGNTSTGGGGDGSGIPEAPNDGVQYGRQSLTWTPVAGSTAIPPGGGTGADDMAIVSPTPPPSPTNGQQWWDGTTMWIWNSTAWQAVGAGATALAFAMAQQSDITIPPSAYTIVPFSASPQIDTGPGWDPVTYKYTPKKAGYYAFSIRGAPGPSGAIALLKNDDGVFTNTVGSAEIVVTLAAATAFSWLSASGFAQMNGTTDYVRYWGYLSATGVLHATGGSPNFSAIHLT